MSNNIKINGHELSKTQIGANEYLFFYNDKSEYQYNALSQMKGKEDVLPTFEPTGKSQTIPK